MKPPFHHDRNPHADWGWIRDAEGNLVIIVKTPHLTPEEENEHRANKTDPAQERVDVILSKINDNYTMVAESDANSLWLPIETCPKEGKFDVCAKVWIPSKDRFRIDRFTNCTWSQGDTLTGRRPGILGVPDSHHAVYWMPIPPLPKS